MGAKGELLVGENVGDIHEKKCLVVQVYSTGSTYFVKSLCPITATHVPGVSTQDGVFGKKCRSISKMERVGQSHYVEFSAG